MESEPENVKELSYLLYLCHNCSLYSHVFWDSLQGIIINCSHVSLLHLTMSSFKVVSTFYLYYILSAYYSSWKKWLLLLETNMSNFKYVIVCSWMIDLVWYILFSSSLYRRKKRLQRHFVMCPQIPKLASGGGRIHVGTSEDITAHFPCSWGHPLEWGDSGTHRHSIWSGWVYSQTPISLRCNQQACWLHDCPSSL